MEYYLTMRKNEIWPFATTWMELEGIMLSEISQSEKDRLSYVFTVMWNLRNLTEDHGGREGENIVKTEREGGKPEETLKYREQTEGGWGEGKGKMGDGH